MSAGAVRLASKAYHPRKPSATALGSICIMHGLLGSAQNWMTPASKLVEAAELRDKLSVVTAVDMRNHGSSPHNPNHTNAALASDVESLVLANQESLHRKLGDMGAHADPSNVTGANTILMGHSMGGFAVMGSLLRRYNEAVLLPEDLPGSEEASRKRFGAAWESERRRATSAAMREVNERFAFAATQPIRDVLFHDRHLTKEDQQITGPIAARVPKAGRVSAAVIVDITPTERLGRQEGGPDSVRQTLDSMLAVDLGSIRTLDDATRELERVGVHDKGMRDFVMTNLSIDATGAKPTTWRCNLSVLASHYGAFQPSIVHWFLEHSMADAGEGGSKCGSLSPTPQPCSLPVLFVFGQTSPYNRPETRRAIPAFFPNASQVVVEGAGHFLHYEKPKGFLDAVLPFLAEHL